MSATFLDKTEISELTGRRAHNLQIAALRRMGLPFWVSDAGRPVVPRSAIEGGGRMVPPVKKEWVMPYLAKK